MAALGFSRDRRRRSISSPPGHAPARPRPRQRPGSASAGDNRRGKRARSRIGQKRTSRRSGPGCASAGGWRRSGGPIGGTGRSSAACWCRSSAATRARRGIEIRRNLVGGPLAGKDRRRRRARARAASARAAAICAGSPPDHHQPRVRPLRDDLPIASIQQVEALIAPRRSRCRARRRVRVKPERRADRAPGAAARRIAGAGRVLDQHRRHGGVDPADGRLRAAGR